MTLQKQAARWQWLLDPKMVVIYALLLPSALALVDAVLSEVCFIFNMPPVLLAVMMKLSQVILRAMRLLATLLLANMLLGQQHRPVRELLRRSWLWILLSAVLCDAVSHLASWFTSMLQLQFATKTVIATLLELGILLLLTQRLLCDKPSWRRVTVLLAILALLLPIAFYSADTFVAADQRAQAELAMNSPSSPMPDMTNDVMIFDPSSLMPDMAVDLMMFKTFGLGHVTHRLFAAAYSLVLVGMCYTLAGGSLFAGASNRSSLEAEPLPMSTEAAKGRSVIGVLLKVWLGLMTVQKILFFVSGEDLMLDMVVLASCIAVFIFYGHRWARRLWVLELGCNSLMTAAVVFMLFPSWQQSGFVALQWLVYYLPMLVIDIIIAVQLLRKQSTVRSYFEYCAISSPPPMQRKWERRAKIVFWVIAAINLVAVGVYLVLESILRGYP